VRRMRLRSGLTIAYVTRHPARIKDIPPTGAVGIGLR